MNNCVFVGRLTDDPEIRYVNNEEQLAVARMSIAVDRRCEKGKRRKRIFSMRLFWTQSGIRSELPEEREADCGTGADAE